MQYFDASQMVKVFFVACTVLLFANPNLSYSQAQPGNSRERAQSRNDLNRSNDYFVDDVGLNSLRIMAQDGYVDPARYRLGPADVLTIEVQGLAPLTLRGLIVNADGALVIPAIGIVSVRDLTVNDAISLIRTEISRKYNASKIDVTLEKLKPVHVQIIIGNESTISSVIPANTRLSGVISPVIQSNQNLLLRHIEIIGRYGNPQLVDLEAVHINGSLDDNPHIQDGDVIKLFPRTWREPRISLTGGTMRQLRVEYREDDSLDKLFRIAGGYRPDADTTFFLIHRIVEGRLVQVRVEGSVWRNGDYPIQANDRIIIPLLPDSYVMHAATINGEVNFPGTYPIIRNNTTLGHIIDIAGDFKSSALRQGIIVERRVPRILPDQGDLFARTSDQYTEGFQYLDTERRLSTTIFLDARNKLDLDFQIIDQDVITIPKDETTVYVFGQVNKTGYYTFKPGQGVSAYIREADGFSLAAEPTRVFIIKAGSYIWLTQEQTQVESGDMIFVDRKPYEDIQTARQYDLQLRQFRNSNYSLALATVTTLATLLSTAYILSR